MIRTLGAFLNAGGPVLWALSGLGVGLFALLILRGLRLRREPALAIAERILVEGMGGDGEDARVASDNVLSMLKADLRSFKRSIRTLNMLAPMLGLLGTVAGMIHTFESLGKDGGSSGIAKGIAEALLTTELGLALAVPGLFAGLWLERREAHLRRSIDALERGEET